MIGTPCLNHGKTDLSFLRNCCRQIGETIRHRPSPQQLIVCICSTVPPSTTRNIVIPTIEKVSGLSHGTGFKVCYHPEFLREGTGIDDFFNPPKTIVGEDGAIGGAKTVLNIYENIPGPKLTTTWEIAEMVKHCGNAFHALKITFANEIGLIALQ